MQTITLEVPNIQDIQLLTPLFQRLGISIKSEEKPIDKPMDFTGLNALFQELNSRNTFAEIEDVVAWQRSIRDEWE